MKIRDIIRHFLLQFDFSKKVLFVLSFSIFAAIYLFMNVVITERSLAMTLQNQQMGLQYHERAMAIYQQVIAYQSQLDRTSINEKSHLESHLEVTTPLFQSITHDLQIPLQRRSAHTHNFYTHRLEQLRENYSQIAKDIDEMDINKVDAQEQLGIHLIELKNHLIDLMDIIINVFKLNTPLSAYDGIQFDLLFNRTPSFQNALSNLLSLNQQEPPFLLYAKLEKNRSIIDHNLTVIEAHRKQSYKNELTNLFEMPLENEIFKDFLEKIIHVSNILNEFKLSTIAQGPWDELKKNAFTALIQNYETYKFFSKTMNERLSEEIYNYNVKQWISGLFLLFGISLVLTPYLTKAFHNPLHDLKDAAEQLAGGNLSVRIPVIRPDEVGEVSKSFNQTAQVFEQIMLETDRFATRLSKSSSEIFNTAKQLEQNLSLQEENVQSITQFSKAIGKNVQEFASSLEQVNDTILVTADHVNLSRDRLSTMESIMQHIVPSANKTVLELSSIKTEINKIKNVINTLVIIADQINLLSLNTAVRANKTGIKKFGFAVIAEKISELADQTAFTTLDIEKVVQQILSVVPQTIEDIDQFGTEVQEALQDSLAVRANFQKLLEMTQLQISSFKNIQNEMIEQTNKANEIEKSFASSIQSIQKTAQAVRGLYVEIEYLYHGTLNLHNMIKSFR